MDFLFKIMFIYDYKFLNYSAFKRIYKTYKFFDNNLQFK